MLIAHCPNCSARYKVSQEMLDVYGDFFQCRKCDSKFNYYDQFSSSSENITGFSRDQYDEHVGNMTDLSESSQTQPQWFNSSLDDEDDSIDQSLITELEHEYQQERAAVLGDEVFGGVPEDYDQQLAPALPVIESDEAEYVVVRSLNSLSDVEEDTKVIGSFGALWIGIKHIVHFSFWSLIILALIALLIYQFKPRLGAELQETINNTPLVGYLCNYFECERNAEKVASLEVVVSRMDLFAEPSEPLNVSLFILNRLKKAQRYPIIKLSLKNLQGLTVGQRFYKPSEYLDNAAANILAGHVGKVVLKLANPPKKAVGFEVALL